MTAEQFDALRPLVGRLSIDSVEIARAVLVDGLKPSEAATRYGTSRQRVYVIVRRFGAKVQSLPIDWRRVEVWLPPELAAQVEAMAEKAREQHMSSTKSDTKNPRGDHDWQRG